MADLIYHSRRSADDFTRCNSGNIYGKEAKEQSASDRKCKNGGSEGQKIQGRNENERSGHGRQTDRDDRHFRQ